MSSTKTALKAIGALIQAAKYEDAVDQARKLLTTDSKNYQANIFLGFALDKQNELPEAERAYEAATKLKSGDPQAWQGLIKLYEKQGSRKVDAYRVAALQLAEVYRDTDDRLKCQDVIDKFTAFAQIQGTRQQYRQSLELILPTSPIYDYLEGRIPQPSYTYQKIVQIVEADEKERMNKEIGERRTRLGAKITQVTYEVQREILRDSPLEDLYTKIIDWSYDDDVRRHFEEKLLKHCYNSLILTSFPEKYENRVKVEKLAGDMVIIKHPYKLAWDIAVEWKDHSTIDQWDSGVLSDYCSFFPEAGLAKVLEGFMNSEISPFPAAPQPHELETSQSGDKNEDDDVDDDDDGGVKLVLAPEERLILMIEGISDATGSILAHRIMGEYYAFLDEHESLVELIRTGRNLVATEVQKTGLQFKNASQSMAALLGTALVFYQSPKNHPEAKTLFDEILLENPTSTQALVGTGLIYEEEEDFPAAISFLQRALQKDPENIRVKAEAAWVKALNGDFKHSRDELEDCLSNMKSQDLRSRDLRAQTQYRIGVCIWNIDRSIKGRKNRAGAYAYFLAALKSNLNYAPAYTSLGIFYSDYTKDKKRARKCFQKAFELSSSEIEAAERLARAFAEQAEWDLVEVVAQRVVDSGKAKPSPGSKKKGISWPFAALGVAELSKQDYTKSVVSFQSALRISPNDYHSWVGLGESYHNSGRYIAATKAFTHAENFEQEVEQMKIGDTWFAKYMLANVKRELGQYDESISTYISVLALRPNEFGICIALIQTLVESAWDCLEKGLFGRSVELAKTAIETGQKLTGNYFHAFNLWKALGDACSVFSWVQGKTVDFPHAILKRILQEFGREEAFTTFSDVDGVWTDVVYSEGLYAADEQHGLNLTRCLQTAILCHKCAIHAAAQDVHAQAVAHFNLGWVEYRAHTCLYHILKKRSTRYLKAAVRCFKRAIELEAGNADFWNALGVVTSEVAPKIAQHSFVRSLFINERSAQTWTNLGALYLLQNDSELAHEAFNRAQSADPAFAHGWLGQGLVALLLGDTREAKQLFTHAIEISGSSSLLPKRQYAISAFDFILDASAACNITDLIHPVFVLNQLNSLVLDDLPYEHLASLFTERIHNAAAALGQLTTISAKIEADYEVTESPASLSRFALVKADLARCQLAAGLYNEAIENGETALQLSDEDAGNELTQDARQKCRLSAYLTVGIAQHYLRNTLQAVEYIKSSLAEARDNPDAICLLAQVLWATRDTESRDSARDQLFDCVEQYPGHVQSVLLLGAIAILDGDMESIEAVTADLIALRTNKTITDREHGMVGEILWAAATLSTDGSEQASLVEARSEIFLFPSHPHGWGHLAEITGDEFVAEMGLNTASKAVPPKGELEAKDLAEAFSATGKAGDTQRAIIIAPWTNRGWTALTRTLPH